MEAVQAVLMQEKYDTVRCHIETMDCITYLDSLPKNSIDVLITDPAYSGMNNYLKLGSGRIVGNYSEADNQAWFSEFKDTEENYLTFLKSAHRAMKEESHLYIMFDSFSLLTLAPLVRQMFNVKNLIVWDKVNIGMGHYFRRKHEVILFATKGKKKLKSRSIPDIWKVKRVRPQYPTQKPVEIFQKMLEASAEPGDNVCDPFLGSGSAAIASVKSHCNFFGCDVSARAVKIAKQRVDIFKRTGKDIFE